MAFNSNYVKFNYVYMGGFGYEQDYQYMQKSEDDGIKIVICRKSSLIMMVMLLFMVVKI